MHGRLPAGWSGEIGFLVVLVPPPVSPGLPLQLITLFVMSEPTKTLAYPIFDHIGAIHLDRLRSDLSGDGGLRRLERRTPRLDSFPSFPLQSI